MLFQFHHPGETPPTLAGLAAIWGFAPEEADAGYGVVPVDLAARIFVIRVTAEGARRIAARLAAGGDWHPATGLFGDPAQGSTGGPT
jgi:hypothetical protein